MGAFELAANDASPGVATGPSEQAARPRARAANGMVRRMAFSLVRRGRCGPALRPRQGRRKGCGWSAERKARAASAGPIGPDAAKRLVRNQLRENRGRRPRRTGAPEWCDRTSMGRTATWRGTFLSRCVTMFFAAGGAVFATVWPGGEGGTVGGPDALPAGRAAQLMEALLLNLMLWGRDEGYGRFNLGMAPLSGLEPSPIAPVWTRVGSFLFARGEVR